MNILYDWQLYHWAIEPSSKCTLKCPRCPRTEYPDIPWLNKELKYKDFVRAFTPSFIKKHVKRFTMCGDVGDPIYCKDYIDIVHYIKTVKPDCHVFTITNGSYKSTDWWKHFAYISNQFDTINFSVDGFNQVTNNKYRVNSDFDSIMNGMNIMGQESAAFVYWAAIFFRFNQDDQKSIRYLAKEHNCDGIQWTKSTKFKSKYTYQYGHIDMLEPRPEFVSSSDRYERHMELLTNRMIDNIDYMYTNTTKFDTINKDGLITPLCMIGNRGMFLNVEGVVHPCGWVSYPYDVMSDGVKKIKYKDSFFNVNRHHFNAFNNGLELVLSNPLWQKLFDSWKSDPFVECNLKCNSKLVDYDYAVGYETN